MNAEGFKQYIEHVADRRLERVGLPVQYHAENPFLMSEAVTSPKRRTLRRASRSTKRAARRSGRTGRDSGR